MYLLVSSVGGIAVRIVALQAIDPGSTPGQRNLLIGLYINSKQKRWQIYLLVSSVGGIAVRIVAFQALTRVRLSANALF